LTIGASLGSIGSRWIRYTFLNGIMPVVTKG
jgi:hypothetical protein